MLNLAALQVTVETTEAERRLNRLRGGFTTLELQQQRLQKSITTSTSLLNAAMGIADMQISNVIRKLGLATTAANSYASAMLRAQKASAGFSAASGPSPIAGAMTTAATFAGTGATMSSNFAPTAVPAPVIASFTGLGGAAQNAGANVNYVTQQLAQTPRVVNQARTSVAGYTMQLGQLYLAYKAITETVTSFASFERQLSAVGALTNANGEQMMMLEERARSLGKTTYFSAIEAAQGMEKLAAAGLSVNQIYDAMGGIMNFAAAGPVSVSEAADVAVRTLSQFNLSAAEAGRVADVLAKASDISRADIHMLGESLRYAGATASTFNLDLEETTAILAVLTQSGLDASMAGTGLRGTIDSLLDPSKEAIDMLSLYGITLDDLNVKTRGLTAVLETLKQLPSTEFGKLFDTRNLTAALISTRDLDTFKQFNSQLKEATGHAERMAAIRNDNLIGDWTKFKNLLTEIAISAGREGGLSDALRTALQNVGDGIRWLDENFATLQVTMVATWNDIANAIDTGATAFLTMALTAGRIVEGIALGVKGAFQTAFAFVEATFSKLLSYITNAIAGTLRTIETVMNNLPKTLTETVFGKDAMQGVKVWRETFEGMTKNMDVNPFQAAMDAMTKSGEEMLQAEKRYSEITDGLAQGNVERMAERAKMLQNLVSASFGITPFPEARGFSDPLKGGNVTGEENVRKSPMFDRFNTAKMSVDELTERIREMKRQLNDEKWISEATEEDFKEANDRMGAMSDALRRRFESNAVDMNRAFQIGFQQTVESYGTLSQRMAAVGSGLADSLESNFTDGFTSIIMGTQSVSEAFANMANSIIADLVRIMVQQLIVRSIMQAFGFMGASSGGTLAGDTFATSNVASVAHTGGRVGMLATFRGVNGSEFNGANRKHSGGMAGDEIGVIAKRNEEILTERDQQELTAGMGRNRTTIINTIDPQLVADYLRENPDAILNVIRKEKKIIKAELLK